MEGRPGSVPQGTPNTFHLYIYIDMAQLFICLLSTNSNYGLIPIVVRVSLFPNTEKRGLYVSEPSGRLSETREKEMAVSAVSCVSSGSPAAHRRIPEECLEL